MEAEAGRKELLERLERAERAGGEKRIQKQHEAGKLTARERIDRLLDQGVSSEALARVHAPIGLDIGAATPDEIAMSILAEILMVNRGGTGQPLSEKGNPLRGEQEGAGI